MAASSDFLDKEFRQFLDTNIEKASKFGRYLETLSAGKPLGMVINDQTNAPWLVPGDKCTITPCSLESLQVGEFAFVRIGEKSGFRRVIKKVIKKKETYLLCKADSSREFDPPTKANMILGKITALERKGKKINVGNLKGDFWMKFTDYGVTPPHKKLLAFLIKLLPIKSHFDKE
jgi:hypothetical protein